MTLGSASAQPALDEEAQPAPAADPSVRPAMSEASEVECDRTVGGATCHTLSEDDKRVHYGVGIRLRSVHVPESILELFVEEAAGGASNIGVGLELTRRRGTVELQLGLEFERISPGEGPWIKKGENVAAGDQADFILSPDDAPEKLGWFTIEFTFLNHAEINKYVSFRYGGGAGIGILTGGLYRYDVVCVGATNSSPVPGCVPSGLTYQGQQGRGNAVGPLKYDLPPVFPVVNAIIGAQIKPIDKLVINVEAGLRTVPFFGITTGYFF